MVLGTILLTFLSLVPCVLGFGQYADQIPNGARVPMPCKDNLLWHGVGHLNVQGGGTRNVFGDDFAAAGHRWTRELCGKDSDGDGRTNGQELGDPQCTWTPGTIPESTTGITHPGICEPIDSDVCSQKPVPHPGSVPYKIQREWMAEACKAAEFVCDALNRTEGVQELDLRMPLTQVPAQETTYMCMMFDLGDELKSQDFHIVATEPIINNTLVMHHMLLFGCPDDAPMIGPVSCNMGGCSALIGAWALGLMGSCFHENAGVRIGQTGYKRMMIQYHWNNPAKRGDLADSSGLKLYYTPNLRPNDMAMLMTGQNHIQIPPRSHDVIATSDCTSTCTRNIFKGDIHVTTAANHMHYLGTSMNIQHYRDGQFLRNLTNELEYHYDTPKFFDFDDPVLLKPGDMIRTTCHFAAPDKTVTTFEGDGTSDEMCYGFLTFYPASNIPGGKTCTTWKSLASCDPATYGRCERGNFKGKYIDNLNETELYRSITSACKLFGPCTDECKDAIRAAKAADPCLEGGDTWLMIKWWFLASTKEGWEVLAGMESCEIELYQEEVPQSGSKAVNTETSDDDAGTVPRSSTLATVAMAMFSFLLLSLLQ